MAGIPQPDFISAASRLLRRMVFIFGVLLWPGVAAAQNYTFTATLDRDTIFVGESTSLLLTFDGAQPEQTPTVPNVANLQIRYVGPSSQTTFINGRVNSRVTYRYNVAARQAGDYTIPSVAMEVNGQRYTTQPLLLKVLPPQAPPANAAAAANQVAFMRLVLPKTNIYLGEIITATFQLYLRDGVEGWGEFQFTSSPTEGVTLGKPVEGQRQRVQLGNAMFTIVPLVVSVTPHKTGRLSIGPVTASISHALPPRNSHEAFFGRLQRVQVTLATELAELQCLSVPTENRPGSFSGAVGNFTMNVSVGPTNVATGDPITVRVQISGRGALDGINFPVQSDWRDFKTYPATSEIEYSDQLGMQGTKTFEQIVSPESVDIQALPPFAFSFFDPETKTFRTLTHPPTPLTVRPGGAVVAPTVAAAANQNSANEPAVQVDIVPIKQRLGSVTRGTTPLLMQPAFLATQSLPVLAFLAAFIWRKRADSLANNPRLRRKMQAEQTIRAGLEKLRNFASQNKSDAFFAEVFRLLQERLGERLDCPASAITEAVVEEKLRPRGVPDSTLQETQELFQLCNQARYAPVRSTEELNAVMAKLEHVLKKLAEVRG